MLGDLFGGGADPGAEDRGSLWQHYYQDVAAATLSFTEGEGQREGE